MLAGGRDHGWPAQRSTGISSPSDPARIKQAKADWRASAAGGWIDTPFTLPDGDDEYIPLPGDGTWFHKQPCRPYRPVSDRRDKTYDRRQTI